VRQTLNLALPAAVTDAACRTASSRSITLPDGSPSTAIEIDNRSGFWLQIYPGASFIKPYAVGVVVAFTVESPSVDVLFSVNGPAGQISTLAGDAVTVTVYDADEAPPSSEGSPFLAAFTPTLSINAAVNAAFSAGTTGTLLAAVAGKRYRLFTARFQYIEDLVTPIDSRATLVLQSTPGSALQEFMEISPRNPIDRAVWSSGLDAPIGTGIQYIATGEWASSQTRLGVTYQLV